jgi:multidrug resistance efflux pump
VCLGEVDHGPFNIIEATSESLVDGELFREQLQAVLKRRKSIVTRVGVSSDALAVNAPKKVTDINCKNYLVTCPLLVDRHLYGAVSIEFEHDSSNQTQGFLKNVEAAVKWLEFLSHSENIGAGSPNAALALQITARALSHDSSSAAASSIVTELATRLSCERVSIAFIEGCELKLYALSHSARYESKQNLIKRIEATIEEAVDQHETLVYPASDKSPYMLQAHNDLAKQHDSTFICTVPLQHNDEIIGGITFERKASAGEFTPDIVELCEQLTALFSPILEYRRLNERPFSARVLEPLKSIASNIFGRSHLGTKFGVFAGSLLLILLFFVQWEYKVSASVVLEGAIERVITAPEEGYIKDATARPGDIVTEGQILATLDDRDLLLEKLKWAGKKKQISKEYREALAGRVRSQIGILRAQLDQADAQIEILDKKLERTVISAPIAGVVISGDFTRALGSPVERGQILYKVSPLDQYRVLLDVDEADVAELSVGMTGELTLSAAAEDTFDIVIDKITPVSKSGDGANYFQVEASLTETPKFLRPGMQGVSKITIGERQLLWIWTHKMVDWLRLKLWAWW